MKTILAKFKKNARWKIVDGMFMAVMMTGVYVSFSMLGCSFIDGLIISRFLGTEAMAGEGIAYPIFNILGVLSGLIATGMQITCTQLMGRGNIKDVNRYISQSIYVGIALAILTALPAVVFPRPFAMLLGAKGNAASLLEPAAQYLFGVGVGIPALFLLPIFAPALQIDSGRKLVRIGAIVSAIADVILDLLAVWLNTGILGIGLATGISSYINLGILCLHFFRKDRMLRFVKPDVPVKEFLKMLMGGMEKATRRLINVFRPVILNYIIISYGGTLAVSALSIRNNFNGFIEIFVSGIASAVSMLSGLYYGEINEEAISEVKNCEWRNIAKFSSAICIILLLFAKPITHLYVSERGEVFYLSAFSIGILGLQQISLALLKSRISYLQAITKMFNMNLLLFSSQFVLIILSASVLGKLFGVYGILSSFLVSDLLSLVAIFIFHQLVYKKPLPGKKEYLDLPDEFDLNPGDVISLDIRNMEDVTNTSEQIQLFCKGHKYDSKTGYYAALTFEEIASNIIRYGFPKNRKKDPIIDFRMVALSDRLVMRIRDDCPHYDITKHIAEVAQDSDLMSQMGIRITSKIAKDIKYNHGFDTNNMIITYSTVKGSVSNN